MYVYIVPSRENVNFACSHKNLLSSTLHCCYCHLILPIGLYAKHIKYVHVFILKPLSLYLVTSIPFSAPLTNFSRILVLSFKSNDGTINNEILCAAQEFEHTNTHYQHTVEMVMPRRNPPAKDDKQKGVFWHYLSCMRECMYIFSCHGNVVTWRGDDGDGRSGGEGGGDGIFVLYVYLCICIQYM